MSLVKMEWTGLLFSIAYAAYLVLVFLGWRENYAGLTEREIRAAESGEAAVGLRF